MVVTSEYANCWVSNCCCCDCAAARVVCDTVSRTHVPPHAATTTRKTPEERQAQLASRAQLRSLDPDLGRHEVDARSAAHGSAGGRGPDRAEAFPANRTIRGRICILLRAADRLAQKCEAHVTLTTARPIATGALLLAVRRP